MPGENLNNKQFRTEQHIMQQGNMDELATRVRGYQNMTSNVYRPAFSSDYTQVRSTQSPASAGATGPEGEEEGEA